MWQFQSSSQQRPLEVESFNSFIKNNFQGMFQVVMWTYPASFVMTGQAAPDL